MKKRSIVPKSYLLAFTLFAFGFSVLGTISTSQTVQAAELTTWQKFIKKKCGDKTADAAERCATNLSAQLAKPVNKGGCGPEEETDTYVKCWRKFIRDNGGTAGPESSPFETEKAPDLEGGCAGAETSIIKCNDDNGNPVLNMIFQIVNFLAIGVGIAVVGGIVWGSLLYTTSNGDSGKAQQGITTIVNSVIGLLLFIFAYAIINFVVPGGVF